MKHLATIIALLAVALGVAAPAWAQATGKWRMGVVRYKADTAFELAGYEKGFYKDQRLDFEPVELPGDAEILRALVAGAVEIAEITPAGTMAAIEKGAPLKIIASFMPGLPHVLFAAKGINTFADLAGQRIGVSALGALPHVVAESILENHRVDPKSVEWIQAGGDPDRVRALVAGQLSATVASIELAPQVQTVGGKVLAVASQELPHWIRFTLITSDKVIKERPGDLVRALVAQAHGIRYAMNPKNKIAMVALMVRYSKRQPKDVEWVYDWFLANKQFNPNGGLSVESLTWMQEVNLKAGRQKTLLPIERMANFDFQKKMLSEIGEVK